MKSKPGATKSKPGRNKNQAGGNEIQMSVLPLAEVFQQLTPIFGPHLFAFASLPRSRRDQTAVSNDL